MDSSAHQSSHKLLAGLKGVTDSLRDCDEALKDLRDSITLDFKVEDVGRTNTSLKRRRSIEYPKQTGTATTLSSGSAKLRKIIPAASSSAALVGNPAPGGTPVDRALPPLGRVVLPAIERQNKIGLVTCRGNGLLIDGFEFEDVSAYLPRLQPLLTKAGKVAKRQPVPAQKPVAWWKAQCGFRGLKKQGTIDILQARLREAGAPLGMTDEFRTLQDELNMEFRVRNAAAREERWTRLQDDEEKAREDPHRFLHEKYRGPNAAHEAIVVKTLWSRYHLRAAAETLHLEHESVEAPPPLAKGQDHVDEWIVIGPDQASILKEIRNISKERRRATSILKEAREKKIKDQQARLLEASGSNDGEWNVAGKWEIDCPYVQEQWGGMNDSHECDIVIGVRSTKDGTQVWASFSFIALEGVFKLAADVHGLAADDQTGEGSEYDDEYLMEDGFDAEASEDFRTILPRNDVAKTAYYSHTIPSSRRSRWELLWRGRETGEGEIQTDFDIQRGFVLFGGPGGTELFGQINTGLAGLIDFTGRKVSNAKEDVDKLRCSWQCLDERAHERERVSRWG